MNAGYAFPVFQPRLPMSWTAGGAVSRMRRRAALTAAADIHQQGTCGRILMPIQLTAGGFQEALTPSIIRQMRVIQLALTAAPLIYLVVVLALDVTLVPGPADDAMAGTLAILSVVHCVLAIAGYAGSIAMFNSLFSEQRIRRSVPEGPVSPELLVTLALTLIRAGMLVRLAFFEGIAFLGLSVCVIGVSTGVIDAHPEFWLNGTTTLILLLFSAMTFPTRERVVQLFDEKLGPLMASWPAHTPSHG